jgi:hypothetical protein
LRENNSYRRHLDAEVVAAFLARTLDEPARTSAFEHLVTCAECREWVAVTAEMNRRARSTRPRNVLLLRIAAGIAVVLLPAWFLASFLAGPVKHTNMVASSVQVRTVVAESAGRARSPRVRVRPHAERTVQLPATLAPMDWDGDAFNRGLPAALQRVTFARVAPRLPAPNQIALQTTAGEKWITIDRLVE